MNRKILVLSSLVLALSGLSACSKDDDKKSDPSDLNALSGKITHSNDQCPALNGTYCASYYDEESDSEVVQQTSLNLYLNDDKTATLFLDGDEISVDGKVHNFTDEEDGSTYQALSYCSAGKLYGHASFPSLGQLSLTYSLNGNELTVKTSGTIDGQSISDETIYTKCD